MQQIFWNNTNPEILKTTATIPTKINIIKTKHKNADAEIETSRTQKLKLQEHKDNNIKNATEMEKKNEMEPRKIET
jgi:hypothetical protein